MTATTPYELVARGGRVIAMAMLPRGAQWVRHAPSSAVVTLAPTLGEQMNNLAPFEVVRGAGGGTIGDHIVIGVAMLPRETKGIRLAPPSGEAPHAAVMTLAAPPTPSQQDDLDDYVHVHGLDAAHRGFDDGGGEIFQDADGPLCGRPDRHDTDQAAGACKRGDDAVGNGSSPPHDGPEGYTVHVDRAQSGRDDTRSSAHGNPLHDAHASGPRLWWHGDPETDVTRRWRVDRLLPEVGVALISGPWGSYKTFVAVDLALSLMVGGMFAGREVNGRCGVLYIAVEGASEIPIRLDGAIRARGLDQSRLPFARADECPRLLDRSAISVLDGTVSAAAQRMRAVHGVELGLVIVDTMAAAAGFGDENSNAEAQRAMNVLVGLAHKHQCLVIAVDHFGKLAETGTRGASAKEASADSILAIIADKDLAGNVSRPRLAIRKVRGAPTGAELPFSMRQVDTDVTLAVEWAAAEVRTPISAAAAQRRSHAATVFHEALIEALDRHGIEHRPYPDGPVVRAVDREQVRTEYYARYPAEGDTDEKRQATRQKAFARSVQQAQAGHAIGVQVAGDTTLIWPSR